MIELRSFLINILRQENKAFIMSEYDFSYYNELISKLKRIRRTGWMRSSITKPESVAEHIFHVASISFFLTSHFYHIDISKVLVLSLLHDLPEAVYGDIPTPQKSKKNIDDEKIWLKNFLKDMKYPENWADDLIDLKDDESRIVKFSDLLATVIQGLEYCREYRCKSRIMEIIENDIQKSIEVVNLTSNLKLKEYMKNILHDIGNEYYSLCK